MSAPAAATLAQLAQVERAVVERIRTNKLRIPPYPAVATKLEWLARDHRHCVADLAAVVSADPALAAAVVGRAHSAAHGGAAVASLAESIQRVGVDAVIQMALALGLGQACTAAGPLGALRRDTWRCALLGARFGQELATRRQLAPDTAYIAGLLRDFGAVVLVAGIEEIGREIPLPLMPESDWQAFVARLQVQVGVAVAARWHLPGLIADVIAHHREAANAPASPLTQLVKIVDRSIAILDRSPATGIAALLEIGELSTNERYALGAAVQDVVAQMASFTAPPKVSVSSRIEPPPALEEEALPVSFEIVYNRRSTYRATVISPNTFEMEGPEPLAAGWLVELVLGCEPEPITLLANIKACDPGPKGFRVVAQPFALAGSVKQQWLHLLEAARSILEDVA